MGRITLNIVANFHTVELKKFATVYEKSQAEKLKDAFNMSSECSAEIMPSECQEGYVVKLIFDSGIAFFISEINGDIS